MQELGRRTLLEGIGTATATPAVPGGLSRGTSGEGRVTVASGLPKGGTDVQIAAKEYESDGKQGALLERIQGMAIGTVLTDLHTVVWDATHGYGLNARNDARKGWVRSSTPKYVPEIAFGNELYFTAGESNYRLGLTQKALVARNRPAVLVKNQFDAYPPNSFSRPEPVENERTVFTVCNPEIGDGRNLAYYQEGEDYDFLVASDESGAVAVGYEYRKKGPERVTAKRWFDGKRIGMEGVTQGDRKSAWNDCYEEDDGWIDESIEGRGDLDLGFGCYLGATGSADWTVGIGLGETEGDAVGNVLATLDEGYEAERAEYTNP